MESEIVYNSVSCWDTRDVSLWIKGLDKTLASYGLHFEAHQICGGELLKITRTQLYYLKVEAVGHQELILEGIELLSALEKSLTQNSTILLASNLSKKASQLITVLMSVSKEPCDVDCKMLLRCKDLAGGVMMAAKNFITWSDRHPSHLISDYAIFRQDVLTNALELSCMMQSSTDESVLQQALGACQALLKLTRALMTPHNFSSVEPIQLSFVKLRPKGNTGLGISVKRSKHGLLVITQIVQGSPADENNIQVGSEIVQINNQNVVGWAITNVVDALKASCHQVTLVLQVTSNQDDGGEEEEEDNPTQSRRHLDVMSPGSLGEDEDTPKETSPTSLGETSPVTPTTPVTPLTPVPKETRTAPTSGDKSPASHQKTSPASPHKMSPAPPSKTSPAPPLKTSPAHQQGTGPVSPPKLNAEQKSNMAFDMTRGISASLQDVTGTHLKQQQSMPQGNSEELEEEGREEGKKGRSVWYHLDPPPSSSPPVRHEGPFEKRLHSRTSSDPSSPNPAKTGLPMQYPPVAYRTAVVGGVVIRIPITQPDEKAAGLKAQNKKKKKVQIDTAPDKNSSSEHEVKRGKTVFSEPKDVSIEGHVMKQVTVSGEQPSFSQENVSKEMGKSINPSLMVPCFQLKDVDLEGWMNKLGGSGLTPKNWRKRWFVLKGGRLYYYKTAFDVFALGIVDLEGYQVESAPEMMKKKSGFNLKLFKDESRTYHFQTENQEGMTRWIEALRRAISASTAGQSMVGVGASDQNSDDSAAIKHVLPQSSQAQ